MSVISYLVLLFPESPMLEIPNTAEDISSLIEGKYGRHVGLLSALRSMKNKRSSKNAYILLLGMTGSGKSATVYALYIIRSH